jgi:hypothetical protein
MKKWTEEGEIDKAARRRAEMQVHCYTVGAYLVHTTLIKSTALPCLPTARVSIHSPRQAMIAWSADMTKWFYCAYKMWANQGIKATPMPAGLKKGTKDYRKEEKRRARDPAEQVAKKARTEAKTLQIPSEYTGIRAGSVFFSVEAAVGGKKKLIAGWYGDVHLAALVYNAFVNLTCHSPGYNHVENHVSGTELKELQRKVLSEAVVESKREKWGKQRSKCVADQDEDMHDVCDEDDQRMDEDEDGAPMEFSRRWR